MRTDVIPSLDKVDDHVQTSHEAKSDGIMTSSLDSIKIQSTNIVDTEIIATVAANAVRKLLSPVGENKQLKNIVDTEKIATVAEKAVRNLLSAKSNDLHASDTDNVSNDKETININPVTKYSFMTFLLI